MGTRYAHRYFLTLIILWLGISFATLTAGELIENKSFQGEKTVIRWSFWGGQETVDLYKRICTKFVEIHPEIIVDLNIYPWGQYWTKLQTQVASGLAPDVMGVWGVQAGVWINHKALLPLNTFIEKDKVNLEEYYKVTLDAFDWEGQLYAFPLELVVGGLVYSKDRFEESGIPPEEWPKPNEAMRWETYKALAQKLTLRDGQGNPIQYAMGSGEGWNEFIYALRGGDFFDKFVNPTKQTVVNNDALLQGIIEAYKNKFSEGIQVPEFVLRTADFQADDILRSSKFAMAVQGPWTLPKLQKMGVRFGISPVPYDKPPHMFVNINATGIYVGSKHPEQAWKLVKYLGSKTAQEMIASGLRAAPVIRTATDAFINNDFGIEDCEAMLFHLDNAAPYLASPNIYLKGAINTWAERTETILEGEYNKRLKALQTKYSVIPDEVYQTFVDEMGVFVETTIQERASLLDDELGVLLRQGTPQEPSTWVRIILPIIFLLLLTSAFVVYLVSIRRNREMEPLRSQTENNAAYAMLSPWLMGLTFFVLGPILIAIYISFTEWNMIKPPEWLGFQHYLNLFEDQDFITGLDRTFRYALLVIPISLIGGIFTAGLLTSDVKGANAFNAIFYFPSLFTGAAAAVLWINMFHREYGIVNRLIGLIGIDPINWLSEEYAFTTVILMNFFWIGGATIIYYAGMKQIPRSLYEAAEIDGANLFRRFFSITIPMLSPVILFMVVMTTIGAFQVFTPALFFARDAVHIGEPGDSLRFYSVNIYNEAFISLNMGKACALAVILFMIIFIITMIQVKLSKRFVHTEV